MYLSYRIAKRRRVFKVETVGDCYVAVCGVPEARQDHALVMAKFARECASRMLDLTRRLEVSLGPGTGDLSLRVGLHSGPGKLVRLMYTVLFSDAFRGSGGKSLTCRSSPYIGTVTAGVLRGERSRFQLFGDTMDTASRMQSTSELNRIQVSEETAKLLMAAGKERWLTQRENGVEAKGKGLLTTYWLKGAHSTSSERYSESGVSSSHDTASSSMEETHKTTRLIHWYVEVLYSLLKQIAGHRKTANKGTRSFGFHVPFDEAKVIRKCQKSTILGEVVEVIELPPPSTKDAVDSSSSNVEIPGTVFNELMHYVTEIADSYHNENPFHNFQHSAHVAMSVVKLLSRIVAPSEVDYQDNSNGGDNEQQRSLHDHTYGITSDPLTQFACVLSALIHDADHPGVPNTQLVKEGHDMALKYKHKSAAEQNSVDYCWNKLMDNRFKTLRSTIYSTEAEFKRFRQLVVNSVMATDIVDKELKELRNAR